MNDLGPGTPLIFIGPDDDPTDPSGLTLNALYFVREVEPCPGGCGGCTISLRGRPGFYDWYCESFFKPLGEPDGEVAHDERELCLT